MSALTPPAPGPGWDRDALLQALRERLPDTVGPADLQRAVADLSAAAGAPQATADGQARLLFDLADQLPVGVCLVGADLQLLIINRAARKLLDLPDSLFASGLPHFSELVLFNARRGEYGPGDAQTLATSIVARARLMQAHHVQRTRPDGIVLDIRGAPTDGGGFCTIWTDITELQRARADALTRAQELRHIIDCVPGTIGSIDRDGTIRLANRRLVEFYHRQHASEVEGHTVRELLGEQRYALAREQTERALAGEAVHYRRHYTRADGVEAWVQVHLAPRFDADGQPEGLTTMAMDITALVESEQAMQEHNQRLEALNTRLEAAQSQLMQSEKLASIGQLAAGVAHEINNPIGFVASNLHSLQRYVAGLLAVVAAYEATEPLLPAASPERALLAQARADADLDYLKEDMPELLAQTHDGLQRVKKIVQDLKDFSHADTGHQWEATDLEACLESTLTIANNEIKYKAQLVKEYGHPPAVECVPSQINQVFLNMVVNAGHAIGDQGRITVRSGHEGDQVWFEFEDDGCGMSAQTRQRIFEPFFTTKAVGKGTGLGLSLSYGIVQKHHGRIECDSEVGRGTRFRIWLPIHQPVALAA